MKRYFQSVTKTGSPKLKDLVYIGSFENIYEGLNMQYTWRWCHGRLTRAGCKGNRRRASINDSVGSDELIENSSDEPGEVLGIMLRKISVV